MSTDGSKIFANVDEAVTQSVVGKAGGLTASLHPCGMENYENLGLVGEGSYGMVLKCRHKVTGQLVAIKKFFDAEDDRLVRKIAMREIKMLKLLRHDNLINLIETFRRRKRLYLVFEFVDHTILDELEKCPHGLDESASRKILWQVLKGTEFCHSHNVVHRDIKPENILVSRNGIVKICDFGFARTLAQAGEVYTDYVATRWYRGPELLVGDTKYGRAVDVWAIGCLMAEILTGEPLFPGESDIDQLYLIMRCFGSLTPRHQEVFQRNPIFVGMRLPEVQETVPLESKFTRISEISLSFMRQSLQLDPDRRPTCTELLRHSLFHSDGFATRFSVELKQTLHIQAMRGSQCGPQTSESKAMDSEKDINENYQYVRNNSEEMWKKKVTGNSKVTKKQSPPKPVSTVNNAATAAGSSSSHALVLPRAWNIAGANMSHNSSSQLELRTDQDKDFISSPHFQVAPPVIGTCNTQTRQTISKLKNEHKWSPFKSLMNGNQRSSFRSLERSWFKFTTPVERIFEERPSLSLPEVKAPVHKKEKHQAINKKSVFSSIPHIKNIDPFTSVSSSQLDSCAGSDKDIMNSGLPNV